jgi:hypothetical protein
MINARTADCPESFASLALEARQPFGVLREEVGQHLDRHVPLEVRVLRAIDFAHPARADLGRDFVRTEACTGGKGHRPSQFYAMARW